MVIRRLIYGYLSQSTDPINIEVPWTISSQDGAFKMNYNEKNAVETNLRVWAKTNWGERPMRFRFGLDAKRYLFEPIELAKEKILNNALEQLNTYFPFLKVDKIDILTSEDDLNIPENTIQFILKAHFMKNENMQIEISEEIGL